MFFRDLLVGFGLLGRVQQELLFRIKVLAPTKVYIRRIRKKTILNIGDRR